MKKLLYFVFFSLFVQQTQCGTNAKIFLNLSGKDLSYTAIVDEKFAGTEGQEGKVLAGYPLLIHRHEMNPSNLEISEITFKADGSEYAKLSDADELFNGLLFAIDENQNIKLVEVDLDKQNELISGYGEFLQGIRKSRRMDIF